MEVCWDQTKYTSCCQELNIEHRRADLQNKLDAPIPWIGAYVAAATLVCSLAMAADVILGIRWRKIWFPCKFFTINAASLTLLAVATKLSVDLTTQMSGVIDSNAKIRGSVFMATAMGNFLTSFASMDDDAILMNVVALGILVVTISVNICIQLYTWVDELGMKYLHVIVLVSMLVSFLTLISSVLTVPTTKRYLEHKYNELHETILWDGGNLERTGKVTNRKLEKVVEKYWVMAETGSPQFVMARSATSATAGIICVGLALITLLSHINLFATTVNGAFGEGQVGRFEPSSYQWSTSMILLIQSIGVAVGTVAPVGRWFTAISFHWRNMFKELKLVEDYWIQKLIELKERPLPTRTRGVICKKVIEDVKIFILNLCIGVQIGIVVASKLFLLISIIITLPLFLCFYYCRRLKEDSVFGSSASTDHESSKQETSGPELDLSDYVLLLEGEAKLPKDILNNMCRELNQVIQVGENNQPKNLMELLRKSTHNFKGVEDFDSTNHVPNCWTLPIVTLTTIAVALPNIENHELDRLITSVSEGLLYAGLLDESFSSNGDDLSKLKCAADVSWAGVELHRKWMDKDLRRLPLKGKTTAEETLQILLDVAQKAATEFQRSVTGGPKVLAANSMYRISQTILKDYQGNTDEAHTDGNLFVQLSIMIADILGACLSNLPRVIIQKCYGSAIEERQKSARRAARLVGETEEIMEILGHHQLPFISVDRAVYIDEWRAFMMPTDPPTVLPSPKDEIPASGSVELHIDVDEGQDHSI